MKLVETVLFETSLCERLTYDETNDENMAISRVRVQYAIPIGCVLSY
jgi:hypothetical protein